MSGQPGNVGGIRQLSGKSRGIDQMLGEI